jgi:hypothetical protein
MSTTNLGNCCDCDEAETLPCNLRRVSATTISCAIPRIDLNCDVALESGYNLTLNYRTGTLTYPVSTDSTLRLRTPYWVSEVYRRPFGGGSYVDEIQVLFCGSTGNGNIINMLVFWVGDNVDPDYGIMTDDGTDLTFTDVPNSGNDFGFRWKVSSTCVPFDIEDEFSIRRVYE